MESRIVFRVIALIRTSGLFLIPLLIGQMSSSWIAVSNLGIPVS